MDTRQAESWIQQLRQEHENDRDGGYGLVHAIKSASDSVDADGRRVLAAVLEAFARRQGDLWAVALEALVQLGQVGELARLGDALASSGHDDEWRDYVVHALLRLKQDQFREVILNHLRKSLERPRHLTIPILAALCRIDTETCLGMAAAYFDDANAAGQAIDVEGFIPAFVGNFADVDDHLLAELVRRLYKRRPDAGHWLALCFNAHLSKPWITREIGMDRALRLRNEVIAAGGRETT